MLINRDDAIAAILAAGYEGSQGEAIVGIGDAVAALRALPVSDGVTDKDAEIRHLREVITFAYRKIQDLRRKGGNGKDGDLWQKLTPITEKMFAESVYMHKDNRQFVPRDEFDGVVKRMRDLETEKVLSRGATVSDGWEDIATAPRDGTEIILFDPSFRRFRIGSWREDDFMSGEGPMWLDDSYDDFSTGFCSCPLRPTHWRPLPAPPTIE